MLEYAANVHGPPPASHNVFFNKIKVYHRPVPGIDKPFVQTFAIVESDGFGTPGDVIEKKRAYQGSSGNTNYHIKALMQAEKLERQTPTSAIHSPLRTTADDESCANLFVSTIPL